jgi:perosamine synthetase
MPPYFEPDAQYPIADWLARRGLSLPTHVQLTEAHVDRICERLIAHVRVVLGDGRA